MRNVRQGIKRGGAPLRNNLPPLLPKGRGIKGEGLLNKMNKYLVIFEKAGENYSAYSPDMPGCIATGATHDEVEKNIREAISFHIEGLKKDRLPIPEPSSSIEYIEA